MKKDFLTHYLRIGLGIFVFGIGICFLMYDNVYEQMKWWQLIQYICNCVVFLGTGLYLLDVKY